MSRIGRQPIPVASNVQVSIGDDNAITVKGPKGELSREFPRDIRFAAEEGAIVVSRPSDAGPHRALHGLSRSLLNNMVVGVTDGFTKTLEVQGVGYRAQLQGQALQLAVGFSHPVTVEPPEGITFAVEGPRISINGIDKEQVGQVAADIRKIRPARAVQGEGHPPPRRAGAPQGRQGREGGRVVAKANSVQARVRRHARVRRKVRGTEARPRLNVFRSSSHIYAQVIDDTRGQTLAAASDVEQELAAQASGQPKTARATLVGKAIAERAKAEGVTDVVFDRGGFKYHGRVKALADGAREGGLGF